MAQIGKIEAKAEIRCDPAKFYDFFRYNKTQLVNMLPQVFKSAQTNEGAEGQPGHVMTFEYQLGNAMTAKIKTEEVNDKERSISFRAIEGEITHLYSTFQAKFSANDGSVECAIEFEKANESAPTPDAYAKLAVETIKGIDLYILNH